MPIGSVPSQKRKRSSKPGAGSITRVVLTGLTGRGRHTKSLVNSRLAANSQAQQLPETHSQDDAEKGDRSEILVSYDSVHGEMGQVTLE